MGAEDIFTRVLALLPALWEAVANGPMSDAEVRAKLQSNSDRIDANFAEKEARIKAGRGNE